MAQRPIEGIPLDIDGKPMLRLTASYRCSWDHARRYLAVEGATIIVLAIGGRSEPLFRYEFVRQPTGSVPTAHLHVHSHRDALTYLMSKCGSSSRRGKDRVKATAPGGDVPRISELHFPVGGSRFRPCLEDVLEMLLDEFGADRAAGAAEALAQGRASWRRGQIGACVRDSPATAAATLRELGYTVTDPHGGAAHERLDRLTEY